MYQWLLRQKRNLTAKQPLDDASKLLNELNLNPDALSAPVVLARPTACPEQGYTLHALQSAANDIIRSVHDSDNEGSAGQPSTSDNDTSGASHSKHGRPSYRSLGTPSHPQIGLRMARYYGTTKTAWEAGRAW
ncbi:hypothetical protein JCM10207_004139 [Rhodosporidiobolus poonsookiae]